MASLTVRNLEEPIKELLRIRAAHNGHSMEEEVRQILRDTLLKDKQMLSDNLAESIQKRFAQLGGVENLSSSREAMREPPEFE